MKKYIYISGILILVIATIFLFFPEFLLFTVVKIPYIPLGTFITWIGSIAWNSFFYYLWKSGQALPSKANKRIKYLFQFLVWVSCLWGFIGFILADNWSMTFSGSITTFRGSYEASLVYWRFNYCLIILPVVLFLSSLIFKKLKRF